MPEQINIVYNAADAIDHFRQVGLEYPNAGSLVEPNEILQVIESKHRRLFALLGFTAHGADVILRVKSLEGEVMMVEDVLENLTSNWAVRIAEDPAPRVSEPHGDLIFRLERAKNG